MATVDLQGAQAQRVRQAYRTFRPTDPSDDEVTNWLSGAFGHGDSDNLDPVISAIENSDEARRSKPSSPPANPPVVGVTPPGVSNTMPVTPPQYPQSPYQNIEWWQGQGIQPNQIFDTTTGQLQSGWQRTGRGYERTGGTTTQTVPGNDFKNWFLNLSGRLSPSGRNLESLGPELERYGVRLGPRNASGMIDTIILPDGSRWDVIESATMDGGVRWHWQPAGTGVGVPNFNYGGNAGPQFNDPYSNQFERMMLARLQELQQGIFDPLRQQYADALQRRGNALGGAEREYTQLMDYLQKRFTDLQGPRYTGAENEVIRTQALDPMERDRHAARQRMTERLAARGITPDSGIFQQAMNDLDREYDAARATTQGALTQNELESREDRQQRAELLGAQLVDIPQARAREQLDVFSALEQLSNLVRQEEEGRRREAIGYGGVLADLPVQRLQLAMQAAGMGGSPDSFANTLFGMAGLNQNANMMNLSRQNSLWSGLGTMAAIIANRQRTAGVGG